MLFYTNFEFSKRRIRKLAVFRCISILPFLQKIRFSNTFPCKSRAFRVISAFLYQLDLYNQQSDFDEIWNLELHYFIEKSFFKKIRDRSENKTNIFELAHLQTIKRQIDCFFTKVVAFKLRPLDYFKCCKPKSSVSKKPYDLWAWAKLCFNPKCPKQTRRKNLFQ